MQENQEQLLQQPADEIISDEIISDEVNEQTTSTQPGLQSDRPTFQEKNFASLRQAKEQSDRENRELKLRLAQMEQQKEPEPAHDPDDLMNRRDFDKKYKQLEEQIQHSNLLTQHPDYYKVVNDATIQALEEKNPALARIISQTGDYYSKRSAVYEAIKNLGIYNEDIYSKDRERAEMNSQKPQAMQSISPSSKSGSPLSHINGFNGELTQEWKNKFYKEMVDAAKNRT